MSGLLEGLDPSKHEWTTLMKILFDLMAKLKLYSILTFRLTKVSSIMIWFGPCWFGSSRDTSYAIGDSFGYFFLKEELIGDLDIDWYVNKFVFSLNFANFDVAFARTWSKKRPKLRGPIFADFCIFSPPSKNSNTHNFINIGSQRQTDSNMKSSGNVFWDLEGVKLPWKKILQTGLQHTVRGRHLFGSCCTVLWVVTWKSQNSVWEMMRIGKEGCWLLIVGLPKFLCCFSLEVHTSAVCHIWGVPSVTASRDLISMTYSEEAVFSLRV